MDSAGKFCLNITLITVIGVLLRIATLYFPDYDSEDFCVEWLPGILTGLLFLAAFLNPKENSCRRLEVVVGCIGIVVSLVCHLAVNFTLVGGHV